ncbi:beta-ketoacyl synthase N-terminal-like domain-containing protein [Streptomyces sp. NPDC058812]|uniref:beta-ketoacyl synthase N-terminal-like domain-containing protein n=1 Tax=unclassified Streptomyces TaxID=2593676 RepID=UPI0036906FB4
MTFPPIAVVGHGCVLPGALRPEELWDTVVEGRTAVGPVPKGRWGIDPAAVLSDRPAPDRVVSAVGGYVRDFDTVFRPRSLGWDPTEAQRLAPVFRWTAHAAAAALETVPGARHSTRTGLVMGNLAYPTAALADLSVRQWRTGNAFRGRAAADGPAPLNRFCFGYPAVLTGRLLGLGAGTLTLDGACASSLYAIKLACDRLHDGEADVMVAGGASGADSLYIHMGFTALGALSARGRSLPLDRRADGLVPAEGAAFVALMRLPDALARDLPVLAVVRGVGWCNNGRRGGFLAPNEDAQRRAMYEAYRQAGMAPEGIGLLECHATGTPLGDSVEIRSSAEVFTGARHLPVGSSKANVGHALPAAGTVGLIKLVQALRTGVVPPATGVRDPLTALAGGPFRLPTEPEDWTGPRAAALSAFGFGGGNAHLVVEAWPQAPSGTVRLPVADGPAGAAGPALAAEPCAGPRSGTATASRTSGATAPDAPGGDTRRETAGPAGGTFAATSGPEDGGTQDLAVVGLGVRLGSGTDVADFVRDLTAGGRAVADGRGRHRRDDRARTAHEIRLALDELPFPPADFADAHPQQAMLLSACQEAVAGLRLPRERTLVMVGAESTPDTARYSTRWRKTRVTAGPDEEPAPLSAPLTANAVVRHMGATLANQVNVALDLTGPGFALSDREASGLSALRLAARAIRADECDAAVVGAVAFPDEEVHRSVLSALGRPLRPVNAAVVLVVKSASAARREGDRILAVLPAAGGPDDIDRPAGLLVGDVEADGPAAVNTAELLGHADCAHGMVGVAVAVAALSRALLPRTGAPAAPWLGPRSAEVIVRAAESVGADRLRLTAGSGPPRAVLTEAPPRLHVFSGADTEAALEQALSYREDDQGPARLVVQANGEAQLRDRVAAAVRWLRGTGSRPEGVHHRARPLGGEVAFVYTGGAATYHGMGRPLLLACPDAQHALAERCGDLGRLVQWLYEPPAGAPEPTAMQRIWASSMLSHLHTSLSRDTLGLRPHSVLGYSSGAVSALISLSLWRELRPLVADAMGDPLFNGLLTGPCESVRAVWRERGVPGSRWATHLIGAPPKRVRELLEGETAVHLTAVNSPTSCMIGGEEQACARVLASLRPAYAFRLAYDVVAHAPEVEAVADRWRAFHHRPTEPLDVRFYDCATGTGLPPTADGVADALTAQATGTVDFASTVEQAYADGVRVFIEHGPKQLCTGWASEVLRDREHLAVALDAAPDRSVHHLFDVTARLAAAGLPVRHEALTRRLTPPPSVLARAARTITVAGSLPPVSPGPDRRDPARAPGTAVPARAAHAVSGGGPARGPGARHAAPRASTGQRPAMHAPVAAVLPEPMRTAGVPGAAAGGPGPARDGATTVATGAIGEPMAGASGPSATGGPGTGGGPAGRPRPAAHRPAPPPASELPGPKFDRMQLERLAHRPVSELFGSRFRAQDARRRQTRLPRPPMLLVDRVTGIDAEPASVGTGVIWTETDVTPDAWYLDPAGRMAPALTVEAGQADLLLISWLGVDLQQPADRVYRLLGCDLTFHGPLPAPGDTLCYRIEITGHAEHTGVRLFFFEYDCWVGGERRISVRNGQAGFFTNEELDKSAGLLWTPDAAHPDRPADEQPATEAEVRSFGSEQVAAFAQGRPADCFGADWEVTRSHLRTPRIADGPHQLIRRVTHFDPRGGPAGAGYLRAELPLSATDWFFEGHFHNDPCMPGTLMLEGGHQAMAFHLAALGLTRERDGWRFEPVLDESVRMRCRGQAVPGNELLTYELFVRSVEEGAEPVLRADLLCTVDGRKSFHAEGLALRLVPDTPLDHWRTLARSGGDAPAGLPVPAAELRATPASRRTVVADGTLLDRDSMLASAWGRPGEAMGPAFAKLSGRRRTPRLPGPPYLCVDRVTELHAEPGRCAPGSSVETEFDLAEDAWFWHESGGTLPTAILMEAALQPCGWLAQFTGCAPDAGQDLFFRNLDGTTTVLAPVPTGTRVLRTRATLREVSSNGPMVLVFFDIECTADGAPALSCSTSFGYFPAGAFDAQTGLGASEDAGGDGRADGGETLDGPPDTDLTVRPEKYCTGPLRIGHPRLVTADRFTRCRPLGGSAGLGSIRGQQTVRADNWYFRAHFYQDPVQPGSLGVETMYQLLRVLLIEKGFAAGMRAPRFEVFADEEPLTWKYRGQVTPRSQQVVIDLEITGTGQDQDGRYAVAQAWLTVDGLRIYHVRGIGLRVTEIDPPEPPGHFAARVLDPRTETWAADHRPAHTAPALPMTCAADLLVEAAQRHTGRQVRAVEDLVMDRWVVLDGPRRLLTEVRATDGRADVRLLAWREAANPALSRYEPVATAVVHQEAGPPPEVPAPLAAPRPALCLPYEDGGVFHGPAFQVLAGMRWGERGSSGVLRPALCGVPRGTVHPGLLDGALHIIPHQSFERWDARIAPGRVAYPRRLVHLRLYEPLPESSTVRVDARFAGLADDDPDRPVTDLFLHQAGRVLATLRLEQRLVPMGFLASYDPGQRRAFLRDRSPLPGPGIGRTRADATVVTARDMREVDWFPGTVDTVFGLKPGRSAGDRLAEVAVRQHVAARCGAHPSAVLPDADPLGASSRNRPLTRHHLSVEHRGDAVTVRESAPCTLDVARVGRWWRERNGDGDGYDLLVALVQGFLTEVEYAGSAGPAHDGPGRLYAHGRDTEPAALVFAAVNAAVRGTPPLLLGGGGWTRRLLGLVFDGPGTRLDPRRCPCAPLSEPPALRAAAHLDHGGDVIWSADGPRHARAVGAQEVLEAALRTGADVHPLRFRPFPPREPDIGEHAEVRTVRLACHHQVAGALPRNALAREPLDAVRAALRALEEVSVRSLVTPSVLEEARPAAVRYQAVTGADPDEALLHSLLRTRTGPSGRSSEAVRTRSAAGS